MAAVREKNEKKIADGAEKSVLCSLWMVQCARKALGVDTQAAWVIMILL